MYFQFCKHRVKIPPVRPAVPAPTGQLLRPQKGQTVTAPKSEERPIHQPKKRITFAVRYPLTFKRFLLVFYTMAPVLNDRHL